MTLVTDESPMWRELQRERILDDAVATVMARYRLCPERFVPADSWTINEIREQFARLWRLSDA